MKLILLSGGSGKRLWPLSNDARSKQFLKVLDNGLGEMESMVQRVWRQLSTLGLDKFSYITANRSQTDMLKSQLGDEIPIILEPERRDTFPAIALAAVYLSDIENVDPDETVCVLPVDPYVDLSYFQKIIQLEEALNKSKADLALMGVTPTYPSEKYGYIVPCEDELSYGYKRVNCFVEKPVESKATELIAKQALWNCGVFAFRLRFLLNILEQKQYKLDYHWMSEHYRELSKISFDYEVVEQTSKVVVIPHEGSWKDLGTWNTLTEEIQKPIMGKGQLSVDSTNTHLINELDIPVTIMGITNAIIAVSPDGILVADKSASSKLKLMLGDTQHRPMYEERLWGWYRILDYTKNDNGFEVLTKRIGIHANKNLSYQIHYDRAEIWTVISGHGECVIEGKLQAVSPGTTINITPGTRHALKAHSDMELIEVQIGQELIEEDIYREAMDWTEILKRARLDNLDKVDVETR
ncbi:sugar phosphate nucleotidyltransferase [Cohnella cholangitidis]|uniref:Mannose-1-phosphate guanylyltransferase n=1 Tax=Cohnella cholangitidis TaxID=2598458 RepID=A0A7G5BXH9_9BACL|nr:sugar phosphate nucleotidyltransferase [Cohnella cholangitidis]QMV41663.1 mannose-1-phosphate guanylyltransferase [Cohnella cholangitidis]